MFGIFLFVELVIMQFCDNMEVLYVMLQNQVVDNVYDVFYGCRYVVVFCSWVSKVNVLVILQQVMGQQLIVDVQ